MPWPGIDAVRARVLHLRLYRNQNNLTRTNYYARFWRDHPEIPWALMANLVSRNAGYQMSDLERYYQLNGFGVLVVPGIALRFQLLCVATFAYLETGNFLILRDVLPALETYRYVRQFPEHKGELLNMLREPVFDADPFVVDELERFIDQASRANWFANWRDDPAQLAAVRRLTFALVSNEQNQIEDRLVNPRAFSRYLGPLKLPLDVLSSVFELLKLTRLAFPLAAGSGAPNVQLLLYRVENFSSLAGRIGIGRDLFVHLFEQGAERYARVTSWCRQHPTHSASRTDYNRINYTLDPDAMLTTGRLYYSPTLVPAWPASCRHTIIYRHLHQNPIPLPVPVRSRPGSAEWLEPEPNPAPSQVAQLGDVAELADAIAVTRRLEAAREWLRRVLP